ncbi:ROK family protein [Sphingobacterium endophyticum]|uniref:ROK family protein n=1 Tax=Sphingobacterium endophyticum TaxID=2546448 RepID=UPI0012E31562|nr:ROK family protein [Sphingobacterium endophyticum]
MQNSNYILSCDIGGTHITSAIVEKDSWKIINETITRSHVNSLEDAKSIFLDWTNNMKSCLEKTDLEINNIGIAAPGPFDYEQGIALMKGQSKYDSIYNIQVTGPILNGLGNDGLNILYINDAAAFLQGEVFGCGLDHKDRILGITLGTGLGSAVWSQGEKAFDADLWNTAYKESIFEEYLVTRWFVRRFEELTGMKETGLREILEKHGNSEDVIQLLAEYQENLLNFMQFFSEKYNCKSFVIGGNIVKAWERIFPEKSILKGFDIQIGKYQEHAAIIGAAALFSK